MKNLNEHEEFFEIKPIGVRYICEFCGKGEMKMDNSTQNMTLTLVPPLIKHVCTNCGKDMFLPKSYPYVEWLPQDKNEINNI